MTDRRPPFYWCHDDQIPDDVTENPLNKALEPLTLSDDEARELDDLLEHSTALPTLPIRGVPHRERTEANDAAEAPQDGETYVSSWDEILYEMTNGERGTPPPTTPRRYEPKPPPPRQTRKKR